MKVNKDIKNAILAIHELAPEFEGVKPTQFQVQPIDNDSYCVKPVPGQIVCITDDLKSAQVIKHVLNHFGGLHIALQLVSAALQSVMIHQRKHMTPGDFEVRNKLIQEANRVIDASRECVISHS